MMLEDSNLNKNVIRKMTDLAIIFCAVTNQDTSIVPSLIFSQKGGGVNPVQADFVNWAFKFANKKVTLAQFDGDISYASNDQDYALG